MKFLSEYRDQKAAEQLAGAIRRKVTRPWTIMEVCGGQTHTIVKSGLDDLLPHEIALVHGPGCPVCVTPIELIDKAIAIAKRPGTIFCSFGDMLRVPGSATTCSTPRRDGADVRIVYSPLDALKLARANPDEAGRVLRRRFRDHRARQRHGGVAGEARRHRQFLAARLARARASGDGGDAFRRQFRIQGFLAAGHVCTIMGFEEYRADCRKYQVPIVVTGFEPLDILEGVFMTIRQFEEGRPRSRISTPAQCGGKGIARRRRRSRKSSRSFAALARDGRDSGQRLPASRALSEVRCQPPLPVRRRTCARITRLHQRDDSAGHQEAARVSGFRREVYAGESIGRAHGIVGRRVCGLSPLWQTPKHQRST